MSIYDDDVDEKVVEDYYKAYQETDPITVIYEFNYWDQSKFELDKLLLKL